LRIETCAKARIELRSTKSIIEITLGVSLSLSIHIYIYTYIYIRVYIYITYILYPRYGIVIPYPSQTIHAPPSSQTVTWLVFYRFFSTVPTSVVSFSVPQVILPPPTHLPAFVDCDPPQPPQPPRPPTPAAPPTFALAAVAAAATAPGPLVPLATLFICCLWYSAHMSPVHMTAVVSASSDQGTNS
jgi:hypothetical protein